MMMACTKNNPQSIPAPAGSDTTTPPVSGVDTGAKVYVSGIINTRPYYQNVYWKNGVVTSLDNGLMGSAEAQNSIFLSDTNIYVAGNSFNATMNYEVATYWKNNSRIVIADN